MASYCRHCSIEKFGQDNGNLQGIAPLGREKIKRLQYCEVCGTIQVDSLGARINQLEEIEELPPMESDKFSEVWPLIELDIVLYGEQHSNLTAAQRLRNVIHGMHNNAG